MHVDEIEDDIKPEDICGCLKCRTMIMRAGFAQLLAKHFLEIANGDLHALGEQVQGFGNQLVEAIMDLANANERETLN